MGRVEARAVAGVKARNTETDLAVHWQSEECGGGGNGMGRCCLAVVALGLGLVAAPPTEAALLRYRPKVGTTTKHRLQVSSRMSFSEEPEQHYILPLKAEVSASLEYAQKITSETEDGVRVETQLSSSEAKVTANDVTETASLGSCRLAQDMDHLRSPSEGLGEIEEDFTEVSDETYHALTECYLTLGEWADWLDILQFPDAEVELGETWKGEAPFIGPFGVLPPEAVVRSRLVELTTMEGRKCAKIETSLDAPLHEDLHETGAPEGLSLQRALRFNLVWYYDYENSVTVLMEGSITEEGLFSDTSGRSGQGKVIINVKESLLE
jgi:hypothetical protein